MSEDCEPDKPVNPAFPTSSPWVLCWWKHCRKFYNT